MAAQDDAREKELVSLFNLKRPPDRSRQGVDAILEFEGQVLEFELKSVTTVQPAMGTVRDLGKDHISKWSNKHWIVAFYSRDELQFCHYLSPEDMAPWINGRWEYIKADFAISETVPSLTDKKAMFAVMGEKDVYSLDDARALHKNQYVISRYRELMDVPNGYSPDRMLDIFRDRVGYLLERGSTLNNPKVPGSYFQRFEPIMENHAIELRARIGRWFTSQPA